MRYYKYHSHLYSYLDLHNSFGFTPYPCIPNSQGWYDPINDENWIIADSHWVPVQSAYYGGYFPTEDDIKVDDIGGGGSLISRGSSIRDMFPLDSSIIENVSIIERGQSIKDLFDYRIQDKRYGEFSDLVYVVPKTVYFTSNGYSETQDTTLSDNSSYVLYDASGNTIPYINEEFKITEGSLYDSSVFPSSDLEQLSVQDKIVDGNHVLSISTGTFSNTANIYSLTYFSFVFPKVSLNNDYGADNWLKCGSPTVLSSEGVALLQEVSSPMVLNKNWRKTYFVVKWESAEGVFGGRQDVDLMDHVLFLAQNNSYNLITFYRLRIAVCDSYNVKEILVRNSLEELYNCLTFTVSGYTYYYVLDETHNYWVADLSSIGYHKNLLPLVEYVGIRVPDNHYTSGTDVTLHPNEISPWLYSEDRNFIPLYQSVENNIFAASKYTDATGNILVTRIGASLVWDWTDGGSGVKALCRASIKNISDTTLTIGRAYVYNCKSLDASVVTVYDSNDREFNAFKYTLEGVDYYYVLDEIQAEWTRDLFSIGYRLTLRSAKLCGILNSTSDTFVYSEEPLCGVLEIFDHIDLLLGIRWDPSNLVWLSKTFSADDWWWAGILSQEDATKLQQYGGAYLTNSSASYQWAGTIGSLQYDGEHFEYELVGMYSDIDGLNSVFFDPFDFYMLPRNYNQSYYPTGAVIQSKEAFGTSVMSYKLRIRKKDSSIGYLSNDKSSVTVSANATPYPLYDDSGQPILYDSSKFYTLCGLRLPSASYGRSSYEYENIKSGYLLNYNGKLSFKCGYASPTVGYVCYREYSVNNHEVLELLLAFSASGGSFQSVTFSSGTQKWAELLNTDDVDRLNAFGLPEVHDGTPYGEVGFDNRYSYQPLALYADINGTQLNTDDMSNFYCEYYSSTNVISIKAINAYSTPSMTWKLRIIKRY